MSTTVVGVRLDVADAEKFHAQARRHGLTASSAGAALIHAAVIADAQREDEPRGQSDPL